MRVVPLLVLVTSGLGLMAISFDAVGGHDRELRDAAAWWYALCWIGFALAVAGFGLALAWTVRRPRPPKTGAFAALAAMSLGSLVVGLLLTFEICIFECSPPPSDAFTKSGGALLVIGLVLVPAGAVARYVSWLRDELPSRGPSRAHVRERQSEELGGHSPSERD